MSGVAVLVLSCDRYAGLWPLFADRWRRFWPSCNLPTFILTNERTFTADGIRAMPVGKDIDWSSSLRRALDSLSADVVLLMIDDAPLDQPVQSDELAALIDRFVAEDMNYLNLKANPLPVLPKRNDPFGPLLPGELYRAALVPALWRLSVLRSLLVDGESSWQFEIRGSRRSDPIDKFFATYRPFFAWIHLVIKGKLDWRALKKLKEVGDDRLVDFPLMTAREYLSCRFVELRSAAFHTFVPASLRHRVRSTVYAITSLDRAMH